ncbi:hypothetical protein MA16_Dca005720 [Dendrobium catenatum]|uniref:Retrotransposon gag domain-containing protein n=1 Tax=Dendrobium catenatum TaxID=906689 RepID=A0A2I0WQF2_9ASPA|nr:hypothetical protein MA16_Dca005720 [Dendrobium catenatum]
MFICGRGKEDYLTGEVLIPPQTDPLYRKWKAMIHQIISRLINSMNIEVCENFLLYEMAQEICEAIKETYSSSDNTSKLFAIETILHDYRQGDLTISQYFNTLTCCWKQLDMFEQYQWKCLEDHVLHRKIIEAKRIFKFLIGLNKNLDGVRGRIMRTKPLPKLREAFSKVRSEERRRKVILGGLQGSSKVEEGNALTVRSNRNPSHVENRHRKKGGRPWFDHYVKLGHTKETLED